MAHLGNLGFRVDHPGPKELKSSLTNQFPLDTNVAIALAAANMGLAISAKAILVLSDSGNSARLLAQFRPRMIPLEQHVVLDQQAHRDLARRLDAALAERDVAAVRDTFRAMSAVNRESAQRAFAALGLNGSRGLHAVEVNAS